jgi:hypothetical protein
MASAVKTPLMSVKTHADPSQPLRAEIIRFRRLVCQGAVLKRTTYYEKPSVKRRCKRHRALQVTSICQRLGRDRIQRMLESGAELLFL